MHCDTAVGEQLVTLAASDLAEASDAGFLWGWESWASVEPAGGEEARALIAANTAARLPQEGPLQSWGEGPDGGSMLAEAHASRDLRSEVQAQSSCRTQPGSANTLEFPPG